MHHFNCLRHLNHLHRLHYFTKRNGAGGPSGTSGTSGPSGPSGARVQDFKIAVPPPPIVHTRARLAILYRPPPLPSEASLRGILPHFPKNFKNKLQTKISKIACTFLVGYRTSLPHTLYYYYSYCSCTHPTPTTCSTPTTETTTMLPQEVEPELM